MANYLTFEEYSAMGGVITDVNAFNIAELKAQNLLNYWTQDRLVNKTIELDVKILLKEMIDKMHSWTTNEGGSRVSSFSNGKVSMTFDVSKTEEQELYGIVKMCLRADLLCRGADKCD